MQHFQKFSAAQSDTLQAALNTAAIQRELREEAARGRRLIELFGKQLEKPWNLKEVSKNLEPSDRIPTILQSCAAGLNLDFEEQQSPKRHNLSNAAFGIFTVIKDGSQYLSAEDYEYLQERFEIYYLSLPPSRRSILSQLVLQNGRESRDEYTLRRVRKFIDDLEKRQQIDQAKRLSANLPDSVHL